MKDIDMHSKSKKEFQVERIVFFSDAVFAIAITLLIIEIKVPVIHGPTITEHAFLEALSLLIPQLFGFVLSFWIIGQYWFIHHRMFGYVVSYNGKLVWLNLLFLFSIVLMPFSTGVYSEYSTHEYIFLISPYFVYVANICFTGIVNFLLWRLIGDPNQNMTEDFPKGTFLKITKIRSLLIPFVFVLSLLFSWLINPIIGRFVLLVIPILMSLLKIRNKEE